ncbi:DoxX family protein [Gordonia sp. CPCC 205515]|uniref:DoxX family protein n=1 Tax=Gordonia sp. CPCC 205515 TaxID=3140791 RepID=UPI003AF3FCE5
MLIRRIARPMLASVFVYAGIDSLRNPHKRAEMATPLIDKSVDVLPNSVTDSVPTEPLTLVRANGAVQVGGGVLLATGKFPRVASLALAGSLIPTTIAGHAFWEETDPVKKSMQRTQFLKNTSLLGGLLIAAVDTEAKPSLAWRGRRKAAAATAAVSAAIPLASSGSDSAWDTIREKSAEGAHSLSALSADAAETVKHRAPELAAAARDRSIDAAEVIKQRGPELAEVTKDRSAEIAEVIRQRAPELGAEIAGLATVAKEKAEEGAEEGRRRWRKATS